jgi:hypothetical protein
LSVFGTPTSNTYYPIHFPPGITILKNDARSGIDFCAYHSNFTILIDNVSYNIAYSVHPSQTPLGCMCGNNPVTENYMVAMAHELAESVTEPYFDSDGKGLSWHRASDDYEIADLCYNQRAKITISGANYSVPGLWSNNAGACVFSAL